MHVERRHFSGPWNPHQFRVALSADFFRDDGEWIQPDVGLSVFAAATYIDVAAFAAHEPLVTAEAIGSAQAVIVRTPRVTAESLANSENLLAVSRFGVGYDNVDVAACTEAGVVLFITPGAVDRSVAEATLTWMLALSHNVRVKDRLMREGEWQQAKYRVGCEIRDRTLGIVGLGRIGRAVAAITRGLGMNQTIAFDPLIGAGAAADLGVRLVSLDELLAEADFVSLHCPLNQNTRNLIGRRELALMKSEAYLLNLARGGIVDEDALYDALKEGRIAGAALDCFVGEPLQAPTRFTEFDNVLLAPHGIAVTREHGREIGTAACRAIVELTKGRTPAGVINPEVLLRADFIAKWKRLTESLGG